MNKDDKNAAKEFEGYPIRRIRMKEDVWDAFKTAKVKSGQTWNNFIKELVNKNDSKRSKN